ncbi:hypothetical protein OCU04_002728 [Sclerotinia nivalis]|uniref:Uncharacterized protein n=1 Tax=Sclerotinia nivalis TaxID=352851 RepID=A0A9X0AU87_9HELO|nr:hypothetical protein OCU04_002728 [Sclerotinia nivalis]
MSSKYRCKACFRICNGLSSLTQHQNHCTKYIQGKLVQEARLRVRFEQRENERLPQLDLQQFGNDEGWEEDSKGGYDESISYFNPNQIKPDFPSDAPTPSSPAVTPTVDIRSSMQLNFESDLQIRKGLMESVLLKEALKADEVLEDSEFRRPNPDGRLESLANIPRRCTVPKKDSFIGSDYCKRILPG